MLAKRMLSRRQCILAIVVLPSLILPAFFLLRMAEPGHADDIIFPQVSAIVAARARTTKSNALVLRPLPSKPRPRKCTEYIWSGGCTDPCYKYSTVAKNRQRKQHVFMCDRTKTKLKLLYTAKQKYVYKIPFKDECLRRVVDLQCRDGKRVPNVVHYVWFGKMEFRFIHLLSFLSVHKFQKPCLILVHGDRAPQGALWKYLLQITPKIIHVQRKAPKKVFKKKLAFVEHKADVAKLEILKEYGGIYLDTDQVLLKSLDPFRNNDITVGKEFDWTIGNSVIIAKRNAFFLKLWLDSYRSYSRTDGSKHSNELPFKLAQKHKDLITVTGNIFSNPTSKLLPALYSKNMDWSEQYGMHMYLKLRDRYYGGRYDLNTIGNLNTTAGAIARHIVFGTKDMCTKLL